MVLFFSIYTTRNSLLSFFYSIHNIYTHTTNYTSQKMVAEANKFKLTPLGNKGASAGETILSDTSNLMRKHTVALQDGNMLILLHNRILEEDKRQLTRTMANKEATSSNRREFLIQILAFLFLIGLFLWFLFRLNR